MSGSPSAVIYQTLLVCAASAIMFHRVFSVFFAVDDFFFLHSSISPLPGPADFVADRYLSTRVLFGLHRVIGITNPALYHVLPFVLHLLNAGLFHRLLLRMAPAGAPTQFAYISTILFALHPAAYGALAWISVGFNEIPVLTCVLAATHLLLTETERPNVLRGLGAVTLLVLATGFKQHAILGCAFALLCALYRGFEAHPRPKIVATRLALPMALLLLWAIYFARDIMPVIDARFGETYQRDYRPASILATYGRLVAALLNPFAWPREAMGEHTALPETVFETASALSVRTVLLLVCGGMIAGAAVAARATRFGIIWAALLIVSLGHAVVVPTHLYLYYGYLALPSACALMGFPLAYCTAAMRVGPGPRRVAVSLASCALIGYGLVAGDAL